jgi:hypothetical protein
MCDPVTMTVLTVASAVGGLAAQDANARAQAKANQQNYDNQMMTYRYNLANANMNKVQESENLAAKTIEINRDVTNKQATASVAAGEAGVSGLSVDALLAGIEADGGRAVANAETNYLRQDRAIETDKMNAWASAAGTIGQMKTPAAPDFMGAALRIGDAAYRYDPTMFQRGTKSAGPTGNVNSVPSNYWK